MEFKKLIDQQFVRLVGAHDGLGAKLIEEAGFEGVWASGLEISTSHCVPDASVLTADQFLERAIEMRRAVNIPIIADIDTGFGTPATVGHYIQRYIVAGIDGVCMEDKMFPKTNSYVETGQMLAPVEEFCRKIMAVKEAAQNFDLFLIARIESLIAGNELIDAIYRADAYVDAGADAIVIHSKSKDGKEIKEFLEKWEKKCPIVIIPTSYNNAFTEFTMMEMGVDIVIYANHVMRAMVRAGEDILKTLAKNGIYRIENIEGIESNLVTVKELFRLQGMDELKKREEKYRIF